ncbi:flagellin N-terminal helical domain-containing protein [Pelagibacterium lentulum]|uniref:Flagellin n=1 Tax=Pelagibacterium lentulum TaxID=2029865 RepID=A0A916RA77_9HYPH|nr:flagellin [Pelagibacterium lentulum]GGA47629.1 hypothetical protein GCM10011499_16810 [Pelagibacterium lentulum]
MSDVTLSKAVRSNLLHLQGTSKMMDQTQTRLATGKRVNSALDNPTNFFTSSALKARASDIGSLLDSMSTGIRIIEAADNGLSSITKTLEQMQSTLRQARQDKSFMVQSYAVDVAQLGAADVITLTGGSIDGGTYTLDGGNLNPANPIQTIDTLDDLVAYLNNEPDLKNRIRASNDKGTLRIENISTQDLEVSGDAVDAGITVGVNDTIKGNNVRANLSKQFNELRNELNGFADDSSVNGINLLRGDQLKIVFNELGTSFLEIEAKNRDGEVRPINSATLGLRDIAEQELDLDSGIDGFLRDVQQALGEVRSQASDFGSTLSIVQNRENFTKNMINTLETAASDLTLADTNEEAANMLALQTRQQLSQTALSLASQADQSVLRLF